MSFFKIEKQKYGGGWWRRGHDFALVASSDGDGTPFSEEGGCGGGEV